MADPMDHIISISEAIGRLEGKLDHALDLHSQVSKVSDDHEVRLRKLEQFRWKQVGMVSGISAGISAAIGFLTKYGFPTH